MNCFEIKKIDSAFTLEIDTIASDKSISHRCAIFSLLSDKSSYIRNYLHAEDTLNSLDIARQLGADIQTDNELITITPPKELQEAENVLDCGNAGTAIRIYSGLLAGIEGFFVLNGDKYLRKRPMKRVIEPLTSIGARINGRKNNTLAPFAITGGELSAFDYRSTIASAQVKSAMILAGLKAEDASYYKEPSLSRDHTERMLKGMGAKLEIENNLIKIHPLQKPLDPLDITVPADPSSGFFFAVAAAITKSTVTLKNMTLNPTRIEAYKVLEKMGAEVTFIEKENKYEPIGDITIKGKALKAVTVEENIAWLIDEIPALSIAMALAKGTSIIKNAKELRAKETDRIEATVEGLHKCGVQTSSYEDGFTVTGTDTLHSATIDSFGDHRIAMSFAVLGLVCGMRVEDTACIKTSFPNFLELLSHVSEPFSC